VSLAALLLVMVAATGCMEEKVVDVVVKGETSVDFQHGPSAEESFTDEYSVNLAAALDNSLADAGYSRSDIKSALLNGGAYGVIAFSPHDWTVEGKVSVQRIDGTPGPLVVAIDYSVQSLEKALGRKIPIPLAEPGATVIDQALGDYISGGDPILRFEVNNEDVAPDPTTSDRIQFEWKIWVEVQVIVEEETEVLDPY
jgi:hypothetical protein